MPYTVPQENNLTPSLQQTSSKRTVTIFTVLRSLDQVGARWVRLEGRPGYLNATRTEKLRPLAGVVDSRLPDKLPDMFKAIEGRPPVQSGAVAGSLPAWCSGHLHSLHAFDNLVGCPLRQFGYVGLLTRG